MPNDAIIPSILAGLGSHFPAHPLEARERAAAHHHPRLARFRI